MVWLINESSLNQRPASPQRDSTAQFPRDLEAAPLNRFQSETLPASRHSNLSCIKPTLRAGQKKLGEGEGQGRQEQYLVNPFP